MVRICSFTESYLFLFSIFHLYLSNTVKNVHYERVIVILKLNDVEKTVISIHVHAPITHDMPI